MLNNRSNEIIAREFWQGTGLRTSFPCDIEKAIALKLPLTLVKLSQLTVPVMRRWLRTRHLFVRVPKDQREMMGCLFAYRGFGIVFVCGADSQDEQRLTVAHETGHFLHDYYLPRQAILMSLGNDMVTVLDGERRPTPAERANAILAHLRLGPHVHLLPRNGRDEESDPMVAEAEARADSLGVELVAPRDCIARFLRTEHHGTTEEVCFALGRQFGLPHYVFHRFMKRVTEPRLISFLDDIRTALK
jgi:hypothetical protein